MDFYKTRPLSAIGFLYNIIAHLEYLMVIFLLRPKLILEVGCGTGTHSCFLSYFNIKCVALEISKEIAILARAYNRRFKGRIYDFVIADAFHLPFKNDSFDVCFSQGVAEHFKNSDIKNFITAQLKVAKKIIISIPSNNFPYKELGDERLLDTTFWFTLLKDLFRYFSIHFCVRYYRLDLRALKNFILTFSYSGPWNILVKIEKR